MSNMPTINSHIIILFVALNRCTIFTVVFISPLDGVIRKRTHLTASQPWLKHYRGYNEEPFSRKIMNQIIIVKTHSRTYDVMISCQCTVRYHDIIIIITN